MTGIRLSIRAFNNLLFYSSFYQSSSSLTYSTAWCIRCRTHCRHLSNSLDYRQPVTGLLHRNRNSNGLFTTSTMKPFLYAVRHKGKKNQKQNKTQSSQEEDDDDEEQEVDPEDISDYEDDPIVPKDYKDVEKAVQSFRFDVVLTAGLDMSRNKIEEAFYDGKLRLNGEKLWKKSRAVKVGDVLDLIIEENRDTGTVTVMRTMLKDVLKDRTSTDKFKVLLRRWKKLTVPKVSEAPKTTGMHITDSNV